MDTKRSQILHCTFLRQNYASKFVFKDAPKAAAEAASESAETRAIDEIIGFREGLSWPQQVKNLVKAALGTKYNDMNTNGVVQAIDEAKLRDKLDDVQFIQIKEGEIRFLDRKQKPLLAFRVADQLKEIITEYYDGERAAISRRANKELPYYFASHPIYGSSPRQVSSLRGTHTSLPTAPRPSGVAPTGPSAAPRASLPTTPPMATPRLTDAERESRAAVPPSRLLTDDEVRANAELDQMFAQGKTKREDILARLDQTPDADYDIVENNVDIYIRSEDRKEFNKRWIEMSHSEEIDRLMRDPANFSEGYTHNPFTELKGNHREILRNLIQKNYNERLYLREIFDLIYTNRFDEVKKTLEGQKVSKVVINELNKGDLIQSYREFRDLIHKLGPPRSADLSKKEQILAAHEGEVRLVFQLLGDYVSYGTRLIQLVKKFRHDPLNQIKDRTKRRLTMHEQSNGGPEAWERNRVIEGLEAVFGNVDNPRLYPEGSFAELKYLFTRRGSLETATYQDMNGTVRTLPPFNDLEWMNLYQSGETAYKMAFEAATIRVRDQYDDDNVAGNDNLRYDLVSEEKALVYLNELLGLGIAAYSALPDPKKPSLKQIIDRLSAAGAKLSSGAKLEYIGSNDLENLLDALSVKNLEELKGEKTEKLEKMIATERLRFIRIGSVIKQKEKARTQEYLGEKENLSKAKEIRVRFKQEHVDQILLDLKATGRFNDKELQKIGNTMVAGGIAVLPNSTTGVGSAYGGAVGVNIPFNNGVSLGITATLINSGSPVFGAGLSVGKHFEVSDKVTVDIMVGGGASLAPVGAGFVGSAGRVTRKFDNVDFSVEAGVGVALGGPTAVMPTGLLGIGLNWGKYQENYGKNLKREMTRFHFDKLTPENAYEETKAHPELYPEFNNILRNLAPLKLAKPSEREIFNGICQVMKENLQNKTLDASVKLGVPSGIGLGVAMAGPVPVPYLYINFPLWKRTLVYRVATNARASAVVSEEAAQQAMLADAAKTGNKIETGGPILESDSEIMVDSNGHTRLRIKSGGKIDFSFLDRNPNQFERYRQTLAEEADIIVNPVKEAGQDVGLMELIPGGANGNEYVYLDPELADSVYLVTRGAKLYISVKKGTQIYFKREDTTYPFNTDGVVEKTVITITGNKYRKHETIRKRSSHYLLRQPESEWSKRDGDITSTTEEAKAKLQANLVTWNEYLTWWNAHPEAKGDRIQLEAFKSQKEAYDKAANELWENASITGSAELDTKIRTDLDKLVADRLFKDKAFMAEYRRNSTLRWDMPIDPKDKRAKKATKKSIDWKEDFKKLIHLIDEKFKDAPLNDMEHDAVLMMLLIESFSEVKKDRNSKEKFQEWLQDKNKFMYKLLLSMFLDFYDGKENKDEKAAKAAAFVLEKLKNVDITAKGEPVPGASVFMSLVGTPDLSTKGGVPITGGRRVLNFHETPPEFGALGAVKLNPSSTDEVERDVSAFFLGQTHYRPGVHKDKLPDVLGGETAKYEQYRKEVVESLQTPLAVKLTILAPLVLDPTELSILAKYYGKNPRTDIDDVSDIVIKKYLDFVDTIYKAEITGKDEVMIGTKFKIKMKGFSANLGLFKKCGNVSTWVTNPNFEAYYLEQPTPRQVAAGMSEVYIDISQMTTVKVYSLPIGFATPIPTPTLVGTPPPPPEQPREPIRIPPPPRRDVPPTPAEVPPTTGKVPPPTTDIPRVPPTTTTDKPNPTTGPTDGER